MRHLNWKLPWLRGPVYFSCLLWVRSSFPCIYLLNSISWKLISFSYLLSLGESWRWKKTLFFLLALFFQRFCVSKWGAGFFCGEAISCNWSFAFVGQPLQKQEGKSELEQNFRKSFTFNYFSDTKIFGYSYCFGIMDCRRSRKHPVQWLYKSDNGL